MAVKVKICGITSVADAEMAVAAGADALGLVFYGPSPRCVSPATAVRIAGAVAPFTTLTGLFVNADEADIAQVLAAVPLNLLQFHGDEDAAFCDRIGRPYIKAIRMKPGVDAAAQAAGFPRARGILLDAWSPGKYGGTGTVFDWSLAPGLERPVILAGGLNPDNVGDAVRAVSPYAVDVSGGVEQAPGVKSADAVRQFVANAKACAPGQ